MSRRQPTPRALDLEVLKLFAEDPEALAVVDAISATQREKPRRRGVHMMIAATVTLLAVAVVGAIVATNSRGGVIERALRTLERPRVLHLALIDQKPAGKIFNLRSGGSQVLHHRLDEWYDRHRATRRLRDQVGAVVVSDERTSAHRKGSLTESFIETYETALARKAAHVQGVGQVHGTRVYWLIFTNGAETAHVAIDRERLRPIELQYGDRRFSIVGFSEHSRIPVARRGPVVSSGHFRPAAPDAGQLVAALHTLQLPPLRTVAESKARVGSTLELRYSAVPLRGKLAGRYLWVRFIPPGATSSLAAVERHLARDSLIVFEGAPIQAFARVDGYQVEMQTNLDRSVPLAVAESLVRR